MLSRVALAKVAISDCLGGFQAMYQMLPFNSIVSKLYPSKSSKYYS